MSGHLIAGLALLIFSAGAVLAQSAQPLTLQEAIDRAKSGNADARIADILQREATTRIEAARAGRLPRVDLVETWQRGNQPVFVFGSLLAQRQFTEANFAIDALNHPDVVDNFRHALLIGQSVYDGGATRAAIVTAELERDAAVLARDTVVGDLAVTTTEAYGAILRFDAEERAAAAALRATEEDLGRARLRYETGLVTQADVLALEVQMASVRAIQIRAAAEASVARARLNQIMGVPLDNSFDVRFPPSPSPAPATGEMEAEAVRARPEVKQSQIDEAMAQASRQAARATFLPQVALQTGWEWNGGTFGTRASSWTIGAEVRLNVFHGFADAARRAAADHAVARTAVQRERAETSVRLEVRTARARLDAARARADVGRTAMAQAREGQRIVRDRYETGLADVTELLRAAQSVLQTESQDVAARVDVLVQSAALDRALGR